MTAEITPRKFLVIDDHPLFCDALAMTLAAIQPESTVSTVNTLGEGLEALGRGGSAPDAVLLDLNLPDVDGVDGLLRIRNRLPDTPVVVISSHDDNRMIASVLRAGAVGFIPKHTGRAELETAFSRIWSGETYTPPSYQPPAQNGTDGDDDLPLEQLAELTPKQSRILQLICEGKQNKQIAWELSIAETTVKAHITAILRKLKVHSRTQAVVIAQKAQFSAILR